MQNYEGWCDINLENNGWLKVIQFSWHIFSQKFKVNIYSRLIEEKLTNDSMAQDEYTEQIWLTCLIKCFL